MVVWAQSGNVEIIDYEDDQSVIRPNDGNPDIFVHISDIKRAGYTIFLMIIKLLAI